MTCAFCPATGDLQTCDFPIYDFAPSAYWRLRVGDKVRRINGYSEDSVESDK
jgi:hypothetical protein